MTDAEYRLFETGQFQRDLEALPPAEGARLERKLKGFVYPLLRTDPHLGPWIKRLKGYKPVTWRFRVGAWRIFYAVDEGRRIVSLLGIALRRDAYR